MFTENNLNNSNKENSPNKSKTINFTLQQIEKLNTLPCRFQGKYDLVPVQSCVVFGV